jgi:hypothetical protein
MLDEGNLEDKSVPHYLSLESCTLSKIIQLWTVSDDTVPYTFDQSLCQFLFNKYKTFFVLIYSYINTSENWERDFEASPSELDFHKSPLGVGQFMSGVQFGLKSNAWFVITISTLLGVCKSRNPTRNTRNPTQNTRNPTRNTRNPTRNTWNTRNPTRNTLEYALWSNAHVSL